MTVRERVLALRLLEKQKKYPEYAERLGVHVEIVEKEECKEDNINLQKL